MSFTYSGNPGASPLDAARFAISDTVEEGALMQDAEINYILAEAKSPSQTLAMLFRHAATVFGARLVKRTLGPQSEDGTARAKYFAEMAAKYEKMLAYAGVPPLPDYQYAKVFEKNMMANGSTATVEGTE